MPALYTILAFSNTGFNAMNRPASISALPIGHTEYSAIYEWQDRYLASIRIDATWDAAKKIDYVEIYTPGSPANQHSYYIVNGIEMLSPRTARLLLAYDPILSAGGIANIQVIGGWAKRAHVKEDPMFGNVLPEPWNPSAPLRYVAKEIVIQGADNSERRSFVVATCDVSDAHNLKAKVVTAFEAADQYVVYPSLPEMDSSGTKLGFPDLNEAGELEGGKVFTLPSMYVFDLGTEQSPNKDVASQVTALQSIGVDAIQNAYVVPSGAIGLISSDQTHFVSFLRGAAEVVTGQDTKYAYGEYVPKNNKVYALYNIFAITSESSGGSNEYAAFDLYNDEESPEFVLISDPSPTGTTYMRPRYYKKALTRATEQAVAGIPWTTAAIMYKGDDGAAITNMQLDRRLAIANEFRTIDIGLANIARNTGMANQIGSSISGFANAPGVGLGKDAAQIATGIFTGTLNDIAAQKQIEKLNISTRANIADINFERQMNDVKAPHLAFPVTVNIASYYGNRFFLTQTGLSEQDMQRLDLWLTSYGYAVDKIFEHDDLDNRQYFNFIQTQDAEVMAANLTETENEQIAEILNAGVRLWHVPPTKAAYQDNPVKQTEGM